jgi:hypothetical protein
MSTIKVDNLQTTGGAGLYPARAWVNFTGTGTVSINDDGNVSSISDLGTGRYQVNYSSSLATTSNAPFSTANYNNTGTSVWADAYSVGSSSFRTIVKSDANATLDAYAVYCGTIA